VSTALVMPQTRFYPRDGGGVSNPPAPQVVPALYAHAALTDRLRLGLALLAPFGLDVSWPDDWIGAQKSLSSRLTVVSANPSLAYRPGDRLGVAAGVSVLHGTVALATALPPAPFGPGGRVDLSGAAWGVAFNLAATYQLWPGVLDLAASYRSRALLPFRGDADFSPARGGFEEAVADQKVSADITLPDVVAVGAEYHPHPRLALAAELDCVLWSAFDHLVIDFERPATTDQHLDRSSVNPLTARLGASWQLADFPLEARAGAALDGSSSRADTLSPSAPDSTRLGLGLGLGWASASVTVDVAYFFAYFLPATSSGPNAQPEGTYRSLAHVIAVTVGVRAGGVRGAAR
jgi:long-chain fatty acid transport protein